MLFVHMGVGSVCGKQPGRGAVEGACRAATAARARRKSNLCHMPSLPLPEGCAWPKATPPSDGLVPALLAYITLINSRLV